MEAMKMKIFVVLMVVLMAFSTMQKAAAADAPAPSPASDATIFVPTFLASLVALAFGTKLKAFVGRMVMSCSLADSIGVYVTGVDGAFNYDCVRHNGQAIEFEGKALAYHVKESNSVGAGKQARQSVSHSNQSLIPPAMVVDGRTVVNGKSTQILSQKGSIVIKLCHPSVPRRFHL
ncbi:hypothetical protein NC653_000179 [Populus alba x Populus x berolinensis]|uniref:Uncharacterized protein n=1 Tax=Populus alba x Populus x berolinensis TaxID=444605 RepID=A0AAD6RJ15_9ROSI|nr:hypothetical protein NC653_000179 [Populus alba x Populus x berolinensis]